ncbi:hypothetical protein KQX54_003734 [Cotesia glomerata]|uniref:C2H2-type domain-containing protein n=1 Tax=Cotesia glomerata TaxID=32391 RepID=A0AAV7IJC9_COTGL|nr:hypothetical protein KQX54_003734 [Cotesia glomerata]
MHMITCRQPSKYKCPDCMFETPTRVGLERHAKYCNPRRNLAEKSNVAKMAAVYSCTNKNCGKTYTNHYELNRHVKFVCGKPPRFKCPYCEYVSKWSADIKKHLKNLHTGQMVYVVKLLMK